MTTFEIARRSNDAYTKEQLQIALQCNVARADTDDEFYRYEDLRWIVKPSSKCMGGVLGPKTGAVTAAELVAR